MDVDTIRAGLEAYSNGLELDRYEVDRGLRVESEARAIRQSYAELFSDDVRSVLDRAVEQADKRDLKEDAASLRLLRAGQIRLHVERQLSPIDAAISRHGRVVWVELTDGTRRPLRDMKLMLASAETSEQRTELENARVEAARVLSPLMSEKIGVEQGIAESLGHPNLVALQAAYSDLDLEAAEGLAEEILSETDALYHEVMGWTVRKRLGIALADARRCDIPYVLAGRYLGYAEAFTAQDMVQRTKGFLHKMGIELTASGQVTVEVERPAGPPRAYAAPVKVPTDVRLVLEIGDGQRDWLAFLQSLGRALYYGHVNQDLPFEQRKLGDGSIDLAYGALFRNLLLDPMWLSRTLGFERPKDYLIQAYLERLYDLRLCCGRVIYDLDLRRRATTVGMEETYVEVMRRAIGVEVPPELYLHDVRTPLHSVIQLRARLFEPQVTLHLLHYFDDHWWANPRTGLYLRQEWAKGSRFTVEELAHDMGASLSPKHLLKLFQKHL
ncbi:MAG: hypothetical protein JKY65_22895 [Planctomycetes bacterium]|nr:hypothetical protein [Planctomycetota bacterium]